MKDKSKSWAEEELRAKICDILDVFYDEKVENRAKWGVDDLTKYITKEIQSARAEGAREFGERVRNEFPSDELYTEDEFDVTKFHDFIDTLLKEYEEKK